ncbi:hypothetical protein [Paenibacillus protaetiae]|uniref:Uncharacterized protein n=1 Tax=Paenibacillus protaetiae TaxID=2509456 RepID=A0A4P6EVS4_9BACL|nr:hypothetical protein [Paenibacillus protaetiae]QAY67142.1 hypothetical protein ET464_12785 [Paenibacillus protaetiae]
MKKWMKRLAALLLALIVLAGGAAWWLKSYIAPREVLDLSYTPIDVKGKVRDMIKHLNPEMVLTEADINNLAKESLGRGAFPNRDLVLDGARFELDGDHLTAYANVTYKKRVKAGAVAVYRLSWQEPNLVMEPETVSIRGIHLPARLAGTRVIPVDVPGTDLVSVKNVKFDGGRVIIRFTLNSPF